MQKKRKAEVSTGELPKPPRVSVSDEDFVRVWQSSDSVAEVSVKLGIAAASCRIRAAKLRKRAEEAGHTLPLKEYGRSYRRKDWEKLIRITEEFS
jgi:hypothetical protein